MNTGKSRFIAYKIQPSNQQYNSQMVRIKSTQISHFKREYIEESHENI